MKKIAVLGCGPAGLLVAHAVEQSGHFPVIFSKLEKSKIPGSQYLHEPIPGVTDMYPENTVQYVRMGTARGYAEKVYGDPDRNTGWENYFNMYPSWNVIRAYDKLWDRFAARIRNRLVTPNDIYALRETHDLVISTLPQPGICEFNGEHEFKGSRYWIRTMPTETIDLGHDIVVYNGRPDDAWYRWSILGDVCSIEYASPPPEAPSADGWLSGFKAISNDCDCHPGVVRAGRWAEWRHGVLLHNAYHTALHALEEL